MPSNETLQKISRMSFESGSVFSAFSATLILGVVFGQVINLLSAFATLDVFGLRLLSYSFGGGVFAKSPNELVNLVVRLSGGAGQALGVLGVFFVVLYFFRRLSMSRIRTQAETGSSFNSRIKIRMLFASETVLLGIAFHGIMSMILQGFFFDNYAAALAQRPDLTLSLNLVSCGLLAFLVLFKLQSKYLQANVTN